MEIGTGLLLLGVYTISDTAIEFVLAGLLAILLFLIAIYDKRHFIIPNSLVVSVAVVAILITGVALWPRGDIVTVLPALAAGVAAGGFFASLWLVSKGRWIGLGDAKLALPLGFLVGPWGAFSFVVLSFWVGAVVSVALLGLKVLARGKHRLPFGSIPITMKSEVPFAPFMIIAFVLVYFFHIDVLVLMGTWFYAI